MTVAVALALVAAGCGEDTVFELDEGAIEATLEQEFDGGLGVFDVLCPEIDSLDPELGGELRCTATTDDLPGVELDVDVVVTAAVDGAISVDAEVVTPLFDVTAAAETVAARLDADLGGDPVVGCNGPRFVVLEPGTRLDCGVAATGGTAGPVDRALTIVILDADGNFEVDFTPS